MQNKIIAFLSHPIALSVIRIIIGGLFIIASVTKITDPQKFADSMAAYQLVPEVIIPPLSLLILWLQFICGIFLVLDIFVQSSALILCGLLIVYTIAISIDFIRGIQIDCGCFDILGLDDKIGLRAIIRDICFLAMTLILVLFDNNGINFYGLAKKFLK